MVFTRGGRPGTVRPLGCIGNNASFMHPLAVSWAANQNEFLCRGEIEASQCRCCLVSHDSLTLCVLLHSFPITGLGKWENYGRKLPSPRESSADRQEFVAGVIPLCLSNSPTRIIQLLPAKKLPQWTKPGMTLVMWRASCLVPQPLPSWEQLFQPSRHRLAGMAQVMRRPSHPFPPRVPHPGFGTVGVREELGETKGKIVIRRNDRMFANLAQETRDLISVPPRPRRRRPPADFECLRLSRRSPGSIYPRRVLNL